MSGYFCKRIKDMCPVACCNIAEDPAAEIKQLRDDSWHYNQVLELKIKGDARISELKAEIARLEHKLAVAEKVLEFLYDIYYGDCSEQCSIDDVSACRKCCVEKAIKQAEIERSTNP